MRGEEKRRRGGGGDAMKNRVSKILIQNVCQGAPGMMQHTKRFSCDEHEKKMLQ